MAIMAVRDIQKSGISAFTTATGSGFAIQGGEIIDFGLGSNTASVTVTLNDITLPNSTVIIPYFNAEDALGSHTANDHRYAATMVALSAGNVSNGNTFTIYATSSELMTGAFIVRWIAHEFAVVTTPIIGD